LRAGSNIPRAVANFRFFATAILHTESEAHITTGVAFNYTLRQRAHSGINFAVEFTSLSS